MEYSPIIFTIGSIEIRWYSLFILIAFITAYCLVIKETSRFRINRDFIFNIAFWVFIFGVMGARAWYVLFNLKDYLSNPIDIIKIWEGGLAIHGGIVAGLIVVFYFCRRYNFRLIRLTDFIVPALLIAQAIGRWGNFFNGEAYGSITSYTALKNVKIIPEFVIQGMNINGSYHVPTFYYESLWCLLGVIVLLIIRKLKYIRLGQTFSLYLIWYSLGRFFIESERTDSLMFGELKAAQLVSIILFVIGIIIFLVQLRKPKLEELYNTKEKVEVVNF